MHCGPIHLRMSQERLFDITFIMRKFVYYNQI